MQPLPLGVRLLPWIAVALFALPLLPVVLGITLPRPWVDVLQIATVMAGSAMLGYWLPLMARRRHERSRELREEYRRLLSRR